MSDNKKSLDFASLPCTMEVAIALSEEQCIELSITQIRSRMNEATGTALELKTGIDEEEMERVRRRR